MPADTTAPSDSTATPQEADPRAQTSRSDAGRVGAQTMVIWNPNAGRVAASKAIKQKLLQRRNTVICEPHSKPESMAMVKTGIEDGCRLIVAAGGDGTINSVLNAVVNSETDATMAVLPLGTANDLCASLMIPDDLDEAVELLDRGAARALDVIEVATPSLKTHFVNVATGGNSERVSETLTEEIKRRWGALCYMRGAIDVLSHLETYSIRVRFDDGPSESFDAWSVLIANGRTSGGRLEIAPRASLEDGLMDVIVIRDGNFLDVAALTARLALSDYTESEQIIYRRARKIAIESDPPIRFAVDGDVIPDYPLGFRVLPGRQRVIVSDDYLASQPRKT